MRLVLCLLWLLMKIKQLLFVLCTILFSLQAHATRIHVISNMHQVVAGSMDKRACKPITLKNRSDETLYVSIRYEDNGVDDWYLDPTQAVEVDMESYDGQCDAGAYIKIETLDHFVLFSDFVASGRKVVIEPYQLTYLRG